MSKSRRYKHNRRIHDREWFKRKLPAKYIQKFTIHHEWEFGETTYLVTYEEHLIITKKEKENE